MNISRGHSFKPPDSCTFGSLVSIKSCSGSVSWWWIRTCVTFYWAVHSLRAKITLISANKHPEMLFLFDAWKNKHFFYKKGGVTVTEAVICSLLFRFFAALRLFLNPLHEAPSKKIKIQSLQANLLPHRTSLSGTQQQWKVLQSMALFPQHRPAAPH